MLRPYVVASPKLFWVFISLIAMTVTAQAQSAPNTPGPVSDAPNLKVTEKLGAQLPLDTALVDESGKAVSLRSYFKPGRPLILTPVYYNCPLLCNLAPCDRQKQVFFIGGYARIGFLPF